MKVSLNCIRDFTDFPENIREYAEKMTMSGTKVEGYEVLGEDITGVVVGKVLTVQPHPNADHLYICAVKADSGNEKPLQIITGAANVKAGDLVPVCKDGGALPGGKVIKKGKLRGELSEGMLCSLSELALTVHDFPYAEEEGIFVIREECAPGDDIRDALMLRDTVVDFELTFNRPDCLAFLGIARETAATFNTALRIEAPAVKPQKEGKTAGEYLSVHVENETLCPRYTARVIRNVKVAPSPLWMRARLRACGVRPINNIVDITNYVMLEYGQPMHAFDYRFIKSKTIVVRNAREGEKLRTLDGVERDLDPAILCIADGERAIALAGIMGGENSEITADTTTVVFESANFNRENVRRTSHALGLRTDSSKRFEKGIPPSTAKDAINRAADLVLRFGCGEVADGIIDVCGVPLTPGPVPFCPLRINKLLGTDISEKEMISLLNRVEITVKDGALYAPPYRNDILTTADAAEEVARLYGLDNIPATLFYGVSKKGSRTGKRAFLNELENTCAALGFSEIYTYSLVSPGVFDKIRLTEPAVKDKAVRILNPIGEETSVLRVTALPSLLSCMQTNLNRRALRARLFESATVYGALPGESREEKKVLCLGFYGGGDFYDLKGYVGAILQKAGIDGYTLERISEKSPYHPGRCARIYDKKGAFLGEMGQIHPETAQEYGFTGEVYAAELEIYGGETGAGLFENRQSERRYTPVPAYPSVERDLALVMDEALTAGEVAALITRLSPPSLAEVTVFDLYRGQGIPEGKKSMAFRLTYRAKDRTLNDAEIDTAIQFTLKGLLDDMGIKLRE